MAAYRQMEYASAVRPNGRGSSHNQNGVPADVHEVCPWNEKFSLPLLDPAFAARAFLAGKDGATLARDLWAMCRRGLIAAELEVWQRVRRPLVTTSPNGYPEDSPPS